MPRPTWKGYLKLSLVSCAVALYTATSTAERVSFNTLNRKTGNRLKQLMVDSESGEPVESAERVKGYQVSKGQYVIVEDDEMEALKIESTSLIDIETFVPQAEVDEVYLDGFYYLAPNDNVAQEAFAVIRDAMARKNMVGVGRVVLGRRERMIMLQPRGKGVLATTLRYPYEVRNDAEYFSGIAERELPAETLSIAELIIDRKSGHFQPEQFTDRYEEAVVGLIQAKQSGEAFAMPAAPAPSTVVNIMDALRRSLEAEGGGAEPARRPRATSKRPAATPKKATAVDEPAAAAGPARRPRARKAG